MIERNKVLGLTLNMWLVLIVTIIAVRAPFLCYFGLSIDAYSNIGHSPNYDFLAGQGRPGAYLLFELLNGLGLYGPIPQYTAVLLSLLLLCFASVLLWRTVIDAENSGDVAVVLGSIIFLAHPYNSEILTYRDAAPVYAISTLIGISGYYLGVARGRLVIATLLMALALSIYQTFINFVIIVWLLTFLLACTDAVQLKAVIRGDVKQIKIRGVIIIIASMVTYIVAIKLLNLALHTQQDGRATFIGLSDVPGRLRSVLVVIRQFFHGDLIAKAGAASVITVSLWLAGFVVCLVDGRRNVRFVIAPVVFMLSCLASIGVILVGHDFWPVPRVIVGFALLPAFGALCCFLYLKGAAKRLLYICIGALLLAYAAIGAAVAADQVRINRRDLLIAAALDARLPLAPGQHIAIVRGPDSWHGLQTQREDMNISAYWASWSKTTALSEFYGYPVQAADAAEQVKAEAYCKSAPVWPAFDSTRVIDGNLAVVCMSRP